METEINSLKIHFYHHTHNTHISKVERNRHFVAQPKIQNKRHTSLITEETVRNTIQAYKTKAKWKWLHVIISFFENNYFRLQAFEYWEFGSFCLEIAPTKNWNPKDICSQAWVAIRTVANDPLAIYTFAQESVCSCVCVCVCSTLEQSWCATRKMVARLTRRTKPNQPTNIIQFKVSGSFNGWI